ncbi:MAG TPA: hypothetical protein VHC18_18020 [Amycolatopsis sp.]|nr:hypothetical protein [Amycolatopsis sp.]
MTAPTWFRRLWRLLGAGRNPLARAGDRLEAWLVVFAAVVAVTAIPIALTVGTEVRAGALATAEAQRATRTPSEAVLLATAPDVAPSEYTVRTTTWVDAVWRLPDGSERTGQISATVGTPAGTHVPIWIDQAGDATTPPMTASNATGLGLSAAALVWVGVLVALSMLVWLVRTLLDRRHAAAWTREWARMGRDLHRF